jgi:hypothetical protein
MQHLQNSKIKQFPPITKQMALEIAQRAFNVQKQQLNCYANMPERCHPYGINVDEPCWYVVGPWNDGILALRSSRLVVISRVTGTILYDGDASDEG